MNKRPVCLVCIGLMIAIWIFRLAGVPVFGAPELESSVREALRKGENLTVEGIVEDRRHRQNSTQYILNHTSAAYRGNPIHLKKIKVTVKQNTEQKSESEDLSIGSLVRIEGKVSEIEAPRNPGQFDSRNYYACQKIYYEMFAEEIFPEREGKGMVEHIARLREAVADAICANMHEDSAGVLCSMILGDRGHLSAESRLNYQYGGIMHVLAISGLHISLLGMLVYHLFMKISLLLSAGRIRRRSQILAAVAASAVMAFYCLLAGSPVSAVRAWVMFCILLGSRILRKSYDLPCALATAGILILVPQPGYLFYAGFQMSFAAVLGAACLYPRLLGLIPPEFWQKGTKKKRIFEKVIQLLFSWLAISLFTFPLTAWYFYEIPVFGMIANLTVVPLMGIIMELGIAGGFLSLALPAAGRIVLLPADLCLLGIDRMMYSIRMLPFSAWICGQPKLWQILLYYEVLAALMAAMSRKKGEKKALRVIGRVLVRVRIVVRRVFDRQTMAARRKIGGSRTKGKQSGSFKMAAVRNFSWSRIGAVRLTEHFLRKCPWIWAVCGMWICLVILFIRVPEDFSLTMLDVGQGDCLAVQVCEEGTAGKVIPVLKRRRVFLIDGGSTNEKQVGKYRILPYLKQQGIRRVDGIFLSHGDADHVNGIEEILEAIKDKETVLRVGRVCMPVWMRKEESGMRIEGECRAIHVPVSYVEYGDYVRAGDLRMEVLHPLRGTGQRVTGNAGSMVIRMNYRGFRALLTGDLEDEGEAEIKPLLQKADVLKVAHHGSKYSTDEEFLQRVSPSVCLISAPERSVYGHPHQETMDRIRRMGAAAFVTRDTGAVRITVQESSYKVQTWLTGT